MIVKVSLRGIMYFIDCIKYHVNVSVVFRFFAHVATFSERQKCDEEEEDGRTRRKKEHVTLKHLAHGVSWARGDY